MRLQVDLDSETLPAAEAKKLERLFARSRFFELPPDLCVASPGADRFQYRLTVEEEGQAHTVRASDSALPPELRPLLDFLTTHRR